MKKYLLITLLASAFWGSTFSAYAAPSALSQSLPDFSSIYDSVGKSVVNINVTQEVQQQGLGGGSGDPMFDYFFRRMLPPQQQKYKQRGLGSGFVISSDGYILTNAHVVANADAVTVKLSDKREFKAKVIGYDKSTDVAVVKIAASDLSAVKIGDPNKLKPGNWVLAIGSPFGLENTITQGIVSALSRNLPDDSTVPFIQSDVPINPGNSGGPLINLDGEVVGINSQIYSKSGGYMGISFSIPIDYAMRIADQLKATGKVVHGRLGIAIQPVTPELASSFGLKKATGALVNGVDVGSSAEKAGIEVGDVILKVNGQDIIDTAILPQVVSNLGPDKSVDLVIWRNGKVINVSAVTMAALDSNTSGAVTNNGNRQPKSIDKLGLVVVQASAAQLKSLGGKISGGVIVQSLSSDAQFAGVASGDIIIGVANTMVNSVDQLVKIISHYKTGETVALKVLRLDGQRLVTIFIPLTVN